MYSSIAQANEAIIERIKAARPHWVAVRPAKEAVAELSSGRKLLHAGPPIAWQEMTGPMRGACIGASLFEGWATERRRSRADAGAGRGGIHPLSPRGRGGADGGDHLGEHAGAGGARCGSW